MSAEWSLPQYTHEPPQCNIPVGTALLLVAVMQLDMEVCVLLSHSTPHILRHTQRQASSHYGHDAIVRTTLRHLVPDPDESLRINVELLPPRQYINQWRTQLRQHAQRQADAPVPQTSA